MNKFCLCIVLFIGISINSYSQEYMANAGTYFQYINTQYKPISKDMWDYVKAIANGKNARKIENRRKELVKTILDAKRKIAATKPYEGDASLRDTTVEFLKIYYSVLNEDYEKIVDLEEIAEQSYDQMEVYINLRRKTNERIKNASDAMDAEEDRFAAKHNITLLHDESKLSNNLEKAGKAFDYYDDIYLVFFKSNIQENNAIEALNKGDFNAAEQCKNSLKQFATEGLDTLAKYKPYKGDATLIVSCKNLFNFYKKEAELKLPVMLDFYLKKESFDEMKKIMDSKGKKASKEEIDSYNKSMTEYNGMVNKFNTVNNELNKEREKRLEDWNTSVKTFLDKHAS